jgi:hypothetical protein
LERERGKEEDWWAEDRQFASNIEKSGRADLQNIGVTSFENASRNAIANRRNGYHHDQKKGHRRATAEQRQKGGRDL